MTGIKHFSRDKCCIVALGKLKKFLENLIFVLPPLKVGFFMPVERAESGRFQAAGDNACAHRERAEKYTFSPAFSRGLISTTIR